VSPPNHTLTHLVDSNLLDKRRTSVTHTLAHDDQVEPHHTPDDPATFWDLVPFFCAGDLALIFTALTLLVEDESNDSKVLGEQQSQLTSYQRRFVGLSLKERESTMRSQSSYYGYSPVQPQLRSPLLRMVFPKWLFWCASITLGPYSSSYLCAPRPYISLILDLTALPSLAYESITHTSFIDNIYAIYGEAGHAPTCAYCLLSFPICLLCSHNITLSHYFFTMTL